MNCRYYFSASVKINSQAVNSHKQEVSTSLAAPVFETDFSKCRKYIFSAEATMEIEFINYFRNHNPLNCPTECGSEEENPTRYLSCDEK